MTFFPEGISKEELKKLVKENPMAVLVAAAACIYPTLSKNEIEKQIQKDIDSLED